MKIQPVSYFLDQLPVLQLSLPELPEDVRYGEGWYKSAVALKKQQNIDFIQSHKNPLTHGTISPKTLKHTHQAYLFPTPQ